MARKNQVWRVMHRVTYVSRIPPQMERAPQETKPISVRRPDNVPNNIALIQSIEAMLPAATQQEQIDLVSLGTAVTAWLDQFPVPPIRPNGSSLVETMKAWRITAGGGWWTDFVQRTAQDATRFMEGEEDAEEKAWLEFERRLRVHRQALQRDVMSYLKGYYELG
jgi:hypothetical protein